MSVNFFLCVCVNFFFRKEKTTLSLVSSRSLLASLREQIRERKALGMKAPYPELCALNDNGYVHLMIMAMCMRQVFYIQICVLRNLIKDATRKELDSIPAEESTLKVGF